MTEIIIGPSLTVRIASHGEPSPPDVARIAVGVADPALARMLGDAIAAALTDAVAATFDTGDRAPGGPRGDANAQRSDGGLVTSGERFPGRVGPRRPVVEMAPPPDSHSAVNGRREGREPTSRARVVVFSETLRTGEARGGDANAQRSDGGLATSGDRFPGRVGLRRPVVEMAPPPGSHPAVNGRREGRKPTPRARGVELSPELRAGQAHGGDPASPPSTVRLRSRKRLAQVASQLGGAIAIVPVTAKNARHLLALVDGIRAAGALGVQLVWDGAVPPRVDVERHVFAVLERARATPGEPPVVVAAAEAPVTALALLMAHRRRKDEPR